jgi:hypothetical protein
VRRLTLSRAEIGAHCVYFLSDLAEWKRSETTYSLVGTAAHACNAAITDGELPMLDEVATEHDLSPAEAERMRSFVRKWSAWAAPQDRRGWLAEAKFAYDLETHTARVLDAPGHRAYGQALPGEICGSADLVYVAEPGRMYAGSPRMVVVVDYKTGWGGRVAPIKRNLQLRSLALCASLAFGVAYAMVQIVHIPDDRGIWVEKDELSGAQLGAVAAQLAEIVGRAEQPGAEPKPGPWCNYCPAKLTCPATADAIAQVIPPEKLTRKIALTIQGEDHFRWQHSVLDLVEAAVKQARLAERRYVDTNGPVTFEDGTIWGGWEGERRDLDAEHPQTIAVLSRYGLQGVMKPHVTLGAISKAAGKAAREVFDELERAGALTKQTSVKYELRQTKAA